MNAQLELLTPFERTAVDSFERAVAAAGGWILGRELLRLAGAQVNEHALRDLRRMASASDQVISGDRGYCHVSHATVEEIRHSADRLLSQMREMGRRVVRLRRSAHQRLHHARPFTHPVAPGVLSGEIPGGGFDTSSPHESERATGSIPS